MPLQSSVQPTRLTPCCRSALLGFGLPPEDAFSPLIVSIVAAALGAPLLLLLLGAAALLCARRRPYSEYEPIN